MSGLSRWSQRKLEERATPQQEGESIEVNAAAEEERSHDVDTQTGDEIDEAPSPGCLDETLPSPETLPEGSDFTPFMAPGVSDALRRRALRRMFSAGHYGIRDGLDDYDEDYRQTLKPLAGELAQRLRQWTKQLDTSDADDKKVVAEPAADPSDSPDTADDTSSDDKAFEDSEVDRQTPLRHRATMAQETTLDSDTPGDGQTT